jgi:hypothetical protein
MAVKQALDPEVAKKAVAEFSAKIDSVIDKLNQPEAVKNGVKTITLTPPKEGVPLYEPGPTAEEQAALPLETPVPEPPLAEAPKVEPLTEAQIFDKCALFLDPSALGPVFISEPIRNKVYIGKYPNFAEMLSSARLMGDTKDASDEALRVYEVAGELSIAIKGWLPAHDQRIDTIKAHITDASKWPALYAFSIFNQRDPRVSNDIANLWLQYLQWKLAVTPTEDELEKYEGRLTKRSS